MSLDLVLFRRELGDYNRFAVGRPRQSSAPGRRLETGDPARRPAKRSAHQDLAAILYVGDPAAVGRPGGEPLFDTGCIGDIAQALAIHGLDPYIAFPVERHLVTVR